MDQQSNEIWGNLSSRPLLQAVLVDLELEWRDNPRCGFGIGQEPDGWGGCIAIHRPGPVSRHVQSIAPWKNAQHTISNSFAATLAEIPLMNFVESTIFWQRLSLWVCICHSLMHMPNSYRYSVHYCKLANSATPYCIMDTGFQRNSRQLRGLEIYPAGPASSCFLLV